LRYYHRAVARKERLRDGQESVETMILCSCNVISDRDVRACVKPCGASADRARDVFRHLGCTPKCGRCVRKIQSLFEQEAQVDALQRLAITVAAE
jgi:bacterioferritin-associated ferredoxin